MAVPATVGGDAASPTEPVVLLASRRGVHLRDGQGDLRRVAARKALVAFGVGDRILFQPAGTSGGSFPARPAGRIRVKQQGQKGSDVLPTAPRADGVQLLDAGVVDGRAVAVVAERFRSADFNDATERIVLVDLDSATTQVIVPHRQSWESGTQAASLLPSGDVVVQYYSEVVDSFQRWHVGDTTPRWQKVVAVDGYVDLAVRGSKVWASYFSFVGPDSQPVLRLVRRDSRDGIRAARRVVSVSDPQGRLVSPLSCSDWPGPAELLCSSTQTPPVVVDARSGEYATSVVLGGQPSPSSWRPQPDPTSWKGWREPRIRTARSYTCGVCRHPRRRREQVCLNCGAGFGWSRVEHRMRVLAPGWSTCINQQLNGCNAIPDVAGEECFAGSLTRTRPSDEDVVGLPQYVTAEQAKRRLVAELDTLGRRTPPLR